MNAVIPIGGNSSGVPFGDERERLRASDAIRALACGYPASVRARKLMVALQAFVDDSACETGDRRLFLAGYINGVEQWEAFSDAWDRELRAHPKIEYFKMAQAQNLKDQFAGWSEPARDQKVLALANVIREHNPWSIHCSVSRKDYAEFLAPTAPAALKNPYFSCFWGIINATARHHKSLGISGIPPVDFIFDEQGGLGDEAVIWYRWPKESEEPSIRDLLGATPIFRDDKAIAALQAADMLAWHLRRAHETGGVERRPAMELLVRGHVYIHLDATILGHMAKGMSRVPGIDLVQDKAEWKRDRKALQARVAAGLGPPELSTLTLHALNAITRVKRLVAKLRGRRRRT